MSADLIPYLAVVAFILSIALGYALRRGRVRKLENFLEAERHQRSALEAENSRIPSLEKECERLQGVARALEHDLGANRAKAERIPVLERTLEGAQATIDSLRVENERLRSDLGNERENSEEKLRLLQGAREELSNSFDALCKRALQTNNQSFLDLAHQSLGKFHEAAKGDLEKRQVAISELVRPVGETLQKFGERVRELELKRQDAYSTLTEQVRAMVDGQTQLRSETTNLVRALRAPQTRGRWGEIQLRRVVEMAGMLNHCSFDEQVSESTDEGRQRPDMIIRLPGGKNVIVDAKVSLAAYLDALEATDETVRHEKLRDHARQVRDHITKLSRKSYWEQFQPTPEFVIMFLSGEAFLYAALEHDPGLIEDGITDRVILATPTTLIAMLKAIAYGWRQENIAENAREISDLGAELYKRLAKVGEHFDSLGSHLNKAVQSYNSSVSSLERNVLTTARKLKEHGVSTGDKEVLALDQIETSARLVERVELKSIEPGVTLPEEQMLL